MDHPASVSSRENLIRLALFGLWAVITFGMIFRAQVSGDQLNLLARGYLFAHDGVLVPFGNPMSGGGKAPGSITSLLVGLPLKLWFSHLSPQFLLWILQLAAYVILDRALVKYLSGKERILFCLCYLLTPWHVFFSVFLWNPHYLYIIAAVHIWAIVAQREKSSFWISLIHTFAIGLGFQLHGSIFILFLHVLILFYLRYIKFSYAGALVGALLVAATLVPWAESVLRDPSALPSSKEGAFFGRGLLYVYPMLRGIVYIAELPSFYPFGRIYRFDFTALVGPSADAFLTLLMRAVGYTLGAVTLFVSIRSMWWFASRIPIKKYFQKFDSIALHSSAAAEGRSATSLNETWLLNVVFLGHVAALTAFAISPTSIGAWQVLVMLPLLALRVVLFLRFWLPQENWFQTQLVRNVRTLFCVGLIVLLSIGLGAPQYRYGGRKSLGLPLRNNHPMLTELHLLEKFELIVYPNGYGWWMDVLPDAYPPLGGADEWKGKPWEDSDWKNGGN